jgi:hypothetical protein
MRRLAVLPIVAAGLVLGTMLPSGRAAPGAQFRLETLLPASTLAFASLEGIDAWDERWAQTALGRLWEEPEVQAFVKPISEDLDRMVKEGEADGTRRGPRIPPVVAKLAEQARNLRGQAAIGLLDWKKRGGPVLAASLDFGDHVSDFTAFLSRLKDEMKDEGPPIKTSERNGRTYWELVPPPPPPGVDPGSEERRAPEVEIAATTLGSAFVLSNDKAWLDRVADANGAEAAGSLASSPSFTGVRAQAGGEGTAVFVYANVPEIVSLVGPDAEARRVMDALGVEQVKSAGYGLAFRGDGFLDTLVVHAPGADRGVFPLLRGRPITNRALPLVPASAFYYEEETTPLSTALPKIREIAGKIDDDAPRDIDEALAQVKERTAIDVEKDLLPGLSDDWAFYAGLPETGGLYPEFAAIVGVKDPAAYEATFEKAVNGLAGHVAERERISVSQRTIEYRGKRLHVVDLDSAKRKKDLIPFTPTWAMLGDRLVITAVPHTMKEIVLRAEAGGPGGLASQEDFQALRRAAPEGAMAMSYLDTQSLFALAYDTLVPLAQTAGKPNLLGAPVRLDWAQLPAARTVRPHLRSLALFVTVDEKGLRLSMHSPTSVLPIFVALGAAAFFVFRAVEMREVHAMEVAEARAGGDDADARDLMRANMLLERVALRLTMHHAQHGALPETLEALDGGGGAGGSLLDPWGNDLRYRALDAAAGTAELRSAGRDGTFGNEDDVVRSVDAAR